MKAPYCPSDEPAIWVQDRVPAGTNMAAGSLLWATASSEVSESMSLGSEAAHL